MPRSSISIDDRVGCLSERLVSGVPLLAGRSAVDDRPHKRMPKANPRPDVHQSGDLCSFGKARSGTESFGGLPQQDCVSERIRRRQKQQLSCFCGQSGDLTPQSVAKPDVEWQSPRQSKATRYLSCCQMTRQLEKGEGVAPDLERGAARQPQDRAGQEALTSGGSASGRH